MKKIVIIGNSAAGISAAEAIREKDKSSQVAIVSKEPFLAYHRPNLLSLLEGKVKERDLYYRSQDFYKNNSLELILEKEVIELNLNKKKVVFKEKDFIGFDELVIATGTKVFLPEIRGIQKEGVIALCGLKDVKFILENFPILHTAIIVGSDSMAQTLARIFSDKKIDVKFFGTWDQPVEGVEPMGDKAILEVLGDSDVKAVRLSSQKVIGSPLVIYTEPRRPNFDFLKNTDIKTNKGIIVDAQKRTSVPFVFAIGDVSESAQTPKTYGWESAQMEGRIAGGALCQM